MNQADVHSTRFRYDAGAAADGTGFLIRPASVLIDRSGGARRILAIGAPEAVDLHPASPDARRVELPGHLLLPGLVNAHTHLDLSRVGPIPHEPAGGFVAWADRIRVARPRTEAEIEQAVEQGVRLCLAGGAAAVGDIAGCPPSGPNLAAVRALRRSPLMGVSFVEFFAIGSAERRGVERVEALLEDARASGRVSGDPDGRQVQLGLQPHAPYSVSLNAYEHAVRTGLPLATHLAESPDERSFIAEGAGPVRGMLERFGIWNGMILRQVGRGQTPIRHLEPILRQAVLLLAHVNDADDHGIEILARCGASVAYCPRASEYFGAPMHFGPHRYRRMLEAGINVCLGTDSVANLPAGVGEPDGAGLCVLDEARVLYRRDGTDPVTLLRMATIHGARALGLDPDWFRFRVGGELAGLAAVRIGEPGSDPLSSALNTDTPVRLLEPVS